MARGCGSRRKVYGGLSMGQSGTDKGRQSRAINEGIPRKEEEEDEESSMTVGASLTSRSDGY